MSSRIRRSVPSRRAFLTCGLRVAGCLGLWVALAAHTPYRQWTVYRQRHLLILASKTDPEGFKLCQAVAETLAEHLPDSRARPSRAPNFARVASLLGTRQMEVAVLPRGEAAALGAGDLAGSGPFGLLRLFDFGAHVFVSRAEFPDAHAYLVVRALDEHRAQLPVKWAAPAGPDDSSLPPHPGALEYLREREG